jgi:hypothetical protein
VLGSRVAHRLFLVISPSLFFYCLLIHVALNPVSLHAYSSPLNDVHTLIINSLSFSVSLSLKVLPTNLGGVCCIYKWHHPFFRRRRKRQRHNCRSVCHDYEKKATTTLMSLCDGFVNERDVPELVATSVVIVMIVPLRISYL